METMPENDELDQIWDFWGQDECGVIKERLWKQTSLKTL